MALVIDRRDQKGSSVTSRQRFLERYKGNVREAIDRAIQDGNVTDMGQGGVDVTVPKEDLSEPTIHHGRGGKNQRVLPGNKEFSEGDRLKRPRGGGGGGGGNPSDGGEGEDDFTFHISEDEFLNILFNDLELPNLYKRTISESRTTKSKYAGLVSQGPYSKLDLVRSHKKRKGRVLSSESKYSEQILDLLMEEKSILTAYDIGNDFAAVSVRGKIVAPEASSKRVKIRKLEDEIGSLKHRFNALVTPSDHARITEIDQQVKKLEEVRRRKVPRWNESTDMRFRFHKPVPAPNAKAVMFCLMDVSGSMDEERKSNAKKFYVLLYKFLKRNYEHVDVVFIRHTTEAQEVDEKEFFQSKETGGTIVSSALAKMIEIMKARYPSDVWNIYGAQASDGDNWQNDSPKCATLLKDILKSVQGFFYTEVADTPPQELWKAYQAVAGQFADRFWVKKIRNSQDIWPAFRDFFKKRVGGEAGARPSAFEMV